MSLSKYLKNNIKEKNISGYEIYKRLGGNHQKEHGKVSYSYIQKIINGDNESPSTKVLKLIAKALRVPFSELLLAAGYIDQHDLEEINQKIRGLLTPMFDPEVVDIITSPQMLDVLERLLNVDNNKRDEALNGLQIYMRGFSS